MRLFHRLPATNRSLLVRHTGAARLLSALPLVVLTACSAEPGADGPPSFSGDFSTSTGNNSAQAGVGSGGSNGTVGNDSAGTTGTSNAGSTNNVGSAGTSSNNVGGSSNTGAGGSGVAGTSMAGNTALGGSSSMGGSATAMAGAGGSMAQGGSDSNPPPPAGCEGLFLCDDFEGVSAGSSPDPALFSIVSNYNYTSGPTANVQVSTAQAYSGSQSVRVEGNAGLSGFIASVPQQTFYVRAFMRLDSANSGPVFMAIGGSDSNDDHNADVRFRIQGQSFATINFAMGDAVLPGNANGGNCPECLALQSNEWFCVEMFVDNPTQTATLWIDGTQAATGTSGGWPPFPPNPRVRFGPMPLQGGNSGVFVDDVAIGPNQIGCD